MVKYKYRNVTVSGLPGVGSSTLGKMLSEELGWKYFSGGDWMRAYAVANDLFDGNQKFHHDQSIIGDEIDRQMDYGMRKRMGDVEANIYDSWLSGFLAQQIDGTLKILMTCSDDAVRVDRLANRDNLTIKEAKKHIFEREKINLQKWARMYEKEWNDWVVKPGTLFSSDEIYFWRPELYDLVIDSFRLSRGEVLKVAMNSLEKGV